MFDEKIFPFGDLHLNVGARFRKEIILLQDHLLNPDYGGVDCSANHATNDHTVSGFNMAQEFSGEDLEEFGENSARYAHEDVEHPSA